MIEGSCLCKAVRFEIDEIAGEYVLCHCPSCRKASGTAFAANVSVPLESFTLVSGESNLSVFESSPNKLRHFCSNCGSPLFTKVGTNPEFVRVRLGSLDSEFEQRPSAQIFTKLRAHWHVLDETIPSFEEWPSEGAVQIRGSHQPGT